MDARIRYTKKVILEMFLELLKEKSLAKITVTELCQRAQINRATFYKYYDNPYDLMNKIEAERLDQLQDEIAALPARTIRSVGEVVLNHLKKEYVIYQVLFSENGDRALIDKILSMCYQENMKTIQEYFPNLPEEKKNWLYFFLGEGCNGVMKRWIEDGMQEDVMEIVEFTGHIVDTLNEYL